MGDKIGAIAFLALFGLAGIVQYLRDTVHKSVYYMHVSNNGELEIHTYTAYTWRQWELIYDDKKMPHIGKANTNDK